MYFKINFTTCMTWLSNTLCDKICWCILSVLNVTPNLLIILLIKTSTTLEVVNKAEIFSLSTFSATVQILITSVLGFISLPLFLNAINREISGDVKWSLQIAHICLFKILRTTKPPMYSACNFLRNSDLNLK
jgi:hypothetical protein